MPPSNLVRFYYGEYDKAYLNWENGKHALADDQCRELISDYQCPRLLQIQAWTLRSVCTDDYWRARDHLTAALNLIASLDNDEDPVLEENRAHAAKMLENLDAEWVEHWENLGKAPPTERRLGDTYVAALSPDATDDPGDAQAPNVLDTIDPSSAENASDADAEGGGKEGELPQKEVHNMTEDELPASTELSQLHLQEPPQVSLEA